eukprot:CAMPEP_0116905158 /NCGR_PEP_ID=MMETSP0467-20121206/11830_1 /TAXON_ID=283647 /ORGANISM="Mesodinium pulex, Strain SPMC105" /LENGTH=161 /DNA_ID=CAMNT_0004579905 /DNA_START=155 /DNA_END=639 /DNA_ORIENTATION=-
MSMSLEEECSLGERVVAEDEEDQLEQDPEFVDVHAEEAEQGVDEAQRVEEGDDVGDEEEVEHAQGGEQDPLHQVVVLVVLVHGVHALDGAEQGLQHLEQGGLPGGQAAHGEFLRDEDHLDQLDEAESDDHVEELNDQGLAVGGGALEEVGVLLEEQLGEHV